MRKPPGFQDWDVPIGILLVRHEEDGRWTILAAEPDIKLDNKHMDRRPHVHVGGWNSDDRRLLRHDLTASEAAQAIRRHLSATGKIDVALLEAELT